MKKHLFHPAAALLAAALLAPLFARAQSVALGGILGTKALLIVNNGAPKGVGAGESHQGVKVVAVGKDEAMVEISGARRTLHLGEALIRKEINDVPLSFDNFRD